jgi:hypothetical protein
VTTTLLMAALLVTPPLRVEQPVTREFTLRAGAEVVATIKAGCASCDWGKPGRETVMLELSVDGAYSQHGALLRPERLAPYRVMLGPLGAGTHRLTVRRDDQRSAANAGPVTLDTIKFEEFGESSGEYAWLSRAPFLHARPGTVERFSDFPVVMYVERDVAGEAGGPYRFQYTVIFTNEDGGTPADRLMATWGRTTDIEFVFGITPAGDDGRTREIIQTEGHQWVEFGGPHLAAHPILWVATDNNMVADHGPPGSREICAGPNTHHAEP